MSSGAPSVDNALAELTDVPDLLKDAQLTIWEPELKCLIPWPVHFHCNLLQFPKHALNAEILKRNHWFCTLDAFKEYCIIWSCSLYVSSPLVLLLLRSEDFPPLPGTLFLPSFAILACVRLSEVCVGSLASAGNLSKLHKVSVLFHSVRFLGI